MGDTASLPQFFYYYQGQFPVNVINSSPLYIRSYLLFQETLHVPYLHVRAQLGTDKSRFVKLYLTILSALFLSQLPIPFICKNSSSHLEQLLLARTDQHKHPSPKKNKKPRNIRKPHKHRLPSYMVTT